MHYGNWNLTLITPNYPEAALSLKDAVSRLKNGKLARNPMNTCASSYKKSSVARVVRRKINGDPRKEQMMTATIQGAFALWKLESDPNYLMEIRI